MISIEELESQYQISEKLYKDAKKKANAISSVRLIAFIVAFALLAIGMLNNVLFLFLLGVLLLGVFIGAVIFHKYVLEEETYYKNRSKVLLRYIDRFSDEWKKFQDCGEEFINENSTVSFDLDLLGKHSLYQLINCGHTFGGRKRLADAINNGITGRDSDIEAKHDAIKELSEKMDFKVNFEALSMDDDKLSKQDVHGFIDFCKKDNNKKTTFINMFRYTMYAITLGSILFAAIVKGNYVILGIIFMINLIASWAFSSKTNKAIADMLKLSDGMDKYIYMLSAIVSGDFGTPLLVELQDNISGDNKAKLGIKRLEACCNRFNIKYNPIIHFVLSGFLLWDMYVYSSIINWKKNYGCSVENWFETIFAMEELISLSTIATIKPVCFGNLVAQGENVIPVFIGTNLRHPLISNEKVVANSVLVDEDTYIITGSNMSGKTTFLRTIGMSIVMANCGMPVCADSITISPMCLYTSMRIVDDISNGISTFYGEILRIKKMVEARKINVPMICLIDEIFRGTNSADRIVGAQTVINNLSGGNCITIVTTHDFELCDVKIQGKNVKNYHFEERYVDGNIEFDFKMKDGKCTTKNALNLLKLAGID